MKKTSSKSRSLPASTPELSSYHRLDALLHTIRCIAQYEDALCEMSHEVRRTSLLTPETSGELRILLEKIPAQDYIHDLDSVREILMQPIASTKTDSKMKEKLKSPARGRKAVRTPTS